MRLRALLAATVLVAGLAPAVRAAAAEAPSGRCGALEEIAGGLCTHGPDPAPSGVDPHVAPEGGEGGRRTAAATPGIHCEGDGSSGLRIEAIYASSGEVDRYDTFADDFGLWAANVDQIFRDSAIETGGVRRPRFLTDPGCNLIVRKETGLSTGAGLSFELTISELESRGYSRSDRKYLIWYDANTYCGIAAYYAHETPGPDNANNLATAYARVDAGCWGAQDSVEAHEIMHMLGGVQDGAPNSTFRQNPAVGGHCSDEYDRMCYPDAPGVSMDEVCPVAHERLFDCEHDDYFSTAPLSTNYLYANWNTASNGWLAGATIGRYVPVEPSRILDTRFCTGGFCNAIGPNQTFDVQVAGRGGVPPSGAVAVVMNVTVTQPTGSSFLTLYPTGDARPEASNLNFVGGQTVPNLVTVKLGANGKVSVWNAAGAAHIIFDVAGWYWASAPGAPGRFQPLPPKRVLDTRLGQGAPQARLGPGGEIDVQVSGGDSGVPAEGASAVVLNATVTNTTSSSFLTVYPDGSPRPNASNLNFVGGETVPNRVIVKLPANGKVRIWNASGETDVILDVGGWFADDETLTGGPGTITPINPTRLLDTRQLLSGPLQAATERPVQITELFDAVPAGASAAVLNVTVVSPTAPSSFLTVYPSGQGRPEASDLNYVAGETVPNLVVVKLGGDGHIVAWNAAGTTHLVVDVVGWFA